MVTWFIRFSLLCVLLSALSSAFPQGLSQGVYAEYHIIPGGAQDSIAIPVKVFASELVSVLENAQYTRAYSVSIECFGEKKNLLFSEYLEGRFTSFLDAKSRSDTVFEGVITKPLPPDRRLLTVAFGDKLADKTLRRVVQWIPSRDSLKAGLFVVSGNEQTSGLTLCNMDGVIPFSDSVSHLLISLPRLSTADYQLQLSTKESSIIFPLHSLNSGGVHLIDNHGGGARVYFDTAHLYQTFIARNLSQKLFPGSYRTKLIIDGDTTLLPQMVKVFWFNAPSTLSNAEKALEMLSIINVKADSLKKLNKKASMEQLLYAFWRKYDTDTTTSYNELMSVFYSRCDYAIENFSTIQRDDGLETDRGKMYVRFGKPLEIERVATRAGKIGEVWKYSESRVFYFVDFSGTGKFEIVDEL